MYPTAMSPELSAAALAIQRSVSSGAGVVPCSVTEKGPEGLDRESWK